MAPLRDLCNNPSSNEGSAAGLLVAHPHIGSLLLPPYVLNLIIFARNRRPHTLGYAALEEILGSPKPADAPDGVNMPPTIENLERLSLMLNVPGPGSHVRGLAIGAASAVVNSSRSRYVTPARYALPIADIAP
jgi:hypothetical protein